MNTRLAAVLTRADRTLPERIAFLEGVMAERERVYPTGQAAWELNPLERRILAWSRRPLSRTL